MIIMKNPEKFQIIIETIMSLLLWTDAKFYSLTQDILASEK